MWTKVWTGSCCVAASVVAVRAGGRGARDAVGAGSWLGLGSEVGSGWGRFCCRSCFCDVWGGAGRCGSWCWCFLVVVVVVVVVLRVVLPGGFRLWFGVGVEVEEDLVPEVGRCGCWVGGVPRAPFAGRCCRRGGRGALGSRGLGRGFGLGRGLVDEVGG